MPETLLKTSMMGFVAWWEWRRMVHDVVRSPKRVA